MAKRTKMISLRVTPQYYNFLKSNNYIISRVFDKAVKNLIRRKR